MIHLDDLAQIAEDLERPALMHVMSSCMVLTGAGKDWMWGRISFRSGN